MANVASPRRRGPAGNICHGPRATLIRHWWCASSLSSLGIGNLPVVRCLMHHRVVIGWLSWRLWTSQIRMVHLYWLYGTTFFHNGDCPEGPEKHMRRNAFLGVVYGERWTTVWMSRGTLTYEPLQNWKCMPNSTWWLCHRSRQQHINTRFGCMHRAYHQVGRRVVSPWILPSGGGADGLIRA